MITGRTRFSEGTTPRFQVSQQDPAQDEEGREALLSDRDDDAMGDPWGGSLGSG